MHLATLEARLLVSPLLRLNRTTPLAASLGQIPFHTRQRELAKGHRSRLCPSDMLLAAFAHSSKGQDSPRKGRKIGSTVLESESDLSKAEEAPLLEEADLKKQSFWQKLSQIINLPGIWLFLQILFGKNRLAIPHVSVPSIAWLDWKALRKAGFEGCVLDKDNTLTHPYSSQIASQLQTSLERCQEAFAGRLVLFSNSAGLHQFDPKGREARALEQELGIPVLRHFEKKPAGGSSSIEEHFGCSSEKLIMIGDRYLTDIVYGNRHGMLTIRPSPLTSEGEQQSVRLARMIENFLVTRFRKQGKQAPQHKLAATPEVIFSFVSDNKIALW